MEIFVKGIFFTRKEKYILSILGILIIFMIRKVPDQLVLILKEGKANTENCVECSIS